MAAPVVQNLNDVISSLTAANQPNIDNLNQQDTDITNEAAQGQQALQGQQTAAFGTITNQANARGATFSGFTPNQQATYTANTYLPALAKLQASIQDSRTALAGQKASLISGINTQAQSTVNDEQTALQTWEDQQAATAAAATATQQQEQFTAGQNALDRAATASDAQISANNQAASAAAEKGTVTKNAEGGYNFYDAKGNPINAAAYATLNDKSVADVLQGSGDKGDQQFINDYNAAQNALANGTLNPKTNSAFTATQLETALKQEYPNLGNFTL